MMVDRHPLPMRYTANFSYPTDQMLSCMSNRSRSDSGTSGSSNSSGGSGKPPRRRSHRPRGCRGGSSRRSRNNSDDNKNVKKTMSAISSSHNNNATATNNTNHNNNNISHNGKGINNATPRRKSGSVRSNHPNKLKKNELMPMILTKQKSIDPRQTTQTDRSNPRFAAPVHEFSFQSQPQPPPGLSFSSYPECGPHNGSFTLPTTGNAEDSWSTFSRNLAGEYGGGDRSFGFDATSYYNHSSSSFDFPFIQQSYSDSSTEAVYFDVKAPQDIQGKNSYNKDDCNEGILPPMPATELLQDEPPLTSGPNPYALNLCTHSEGKSSHQPSQSSASVHMKPTMIVDTTGFAKSGSKHQEKSQQQMRGFGDIIQKQESAIHQSYPHQQHHRHSQDYRSVRIEKQRQTVEGGSLFVTSPRSFLMGWKRTDLAVSA